LLEYDKIICSKLEKTAELLSLLYRQNLITEAYIVGSISRGVAKDKSDIDIFLINPNFEETNTQLFPDIEHYNIKKLVDYLKSINVKFEKLDIPTKDIFGHYFQIYKDEIFHVMYGGNFESMESNEYLKITKAYCNGNIYH
jgi:predicted nucleotidyltransferase